jgi:hypothetical protein
MGLHHLRLVEERNEWLIRRLNQQELKRVSVECDAFQRSENGMQEGPPSDCESTLVNEQKLTRRRYIYVLLPISLMCPPEKIPFS